MQDETKQESSQPHRAESRRVERTCSCGHKWLGRATDNCPVCKGGDVHTGDEVFTKNVFDNDLMK